MHIVFMTRGIKHDAERFINDLAGKYLPFEYKKKKGLLQVRVSPVQLWDVSFPKEHEEVMLNTIFKKGKGMPLHKKLNKIIAVVRRMLGLRKIPEYKEGKHLPVVRENVETIAIGMKDDEDFEWGEGI